MINLINCFNDEGIKFGLLLLYLQHIGDFNYSRLADFGAAISGANKSQCQQVLEELDVSIICYVNFFNELKFHFSFILI